MLALDRFTLGPVNFEMSFGHPSGDVRWLRYMNLETESHITVCNV